MGRSRSRSRSPPARRRTRSPPIRSSYNRSRSRSPPIRSSARDSYRNRDTYSDRDRDREHDHRKEADNGRGRYAYDERGRGSYGDRRRDAYDERDHERDRDHRHAQRRGSPKYKPYEKEVRALAPPPRGGDQDVSDDDIRGGDRMEYRRKLREKKAARGIGLLWNNTPTPSPEREPTPPAQKLEEPEPSPKDTAGKSAQPLSSSKKKKSKKSRKSPSPETSDDASNDSDAKGKKVTKGKKSKSSHKSRTSKGKRKKRKEESSSSESSSSSSSSDSDSGGSSDGPSEEGGGGEGAAERLELEAGSDDEETKKFKEYMEKQRLAAQGPAHAVEEFIGPELPSTAGGHATSFGGAMRPGEGEAIAQYVQAGKRIPRRGEVGLSADEISHFEDIGYVMSGSRHSKMNAIRIRKENQVYSAEEKAALAMINYEEKAEREQKVLADLRKLVERHLGSSATDQ